MECPHLDARQIAELSGGGDMEDPIRREFLWAPTNHEPPKLFEAYYVVRPTSDGWTEEQLVHGSLQVIGEKEVQE